MGENWGYGAMGRLVGVQGYTGVDFLRLLWVWFGVQGREVKLRGVGVGVESFRRGFGRMVDM